MKPLKTLIGKAKWFWQILIYIVLLIAGGFGVNYSFVLLNLPSTLLNVVGIVAIACTAYFCLSILWELFKFAFMILMALAADSINEDGEYHS